MSKVHFFEHGPNEVEISHIQVDPDKRAQGIGNTLMGTATDLADQHGVTLHASPASDADGSAGLDYEGLRDWYQRWGFDERGGGDRLTRSPSTTAPGDVPPPGIVAYHGSPHSFDQFDTSKIGTGEGAQVYGHGLYFAGKEGVARSYRDALAGPPPNSGVQVNGVPAEDAGLSPSAIALAKMHLDGFSTLDDLRASNEASLQRAQDALQRMPNSSVGIANRDMANRTLDALDELKGRDLSFQQPKSPGSMYQVNIGADPEHFLDWDKPLSEQHPVVENAIADLVAQHRIQMGNATGARAYHSLAERLAPPPPPDPTGWGSVPGGPVAYDAQVHDPAAAARRSKPLAFPASATSTKAVAALGKVATTTSCSTPPRSTSCASMASPACRMAVAPQPPEPSNSSRASERLAKALDPASHTSRVVLQDVHHAEHHQVIVGSEFRVLAQVAAH